MPENEKTNAEKLHPTLKWSKEKSYFVNILRFHNFKGALCKTIPLKTYQINVSAECEEIHFPIVLLRYFIKLAANTGPCRFVMPLYTIRGNCCHCNIHILASCQSRPMCTEKCNADSPTVSL